MILTAYHTGRMYHQPVDLESPLVVQNMLFMTTVSGRISVRFHFLCSYLPI